MTVHVDNHEVLILQQPEKVELCDEELIAMAMSLRTLAFPGTLVFPDENVIEHYLMVRLICIQQTGVDTDILAHHMDRLSTQARVD